LGLATHSDYAAAGSANDAPREKLRHEVIATYPTCSLHFRARAFAIFSDEALDPCRDNGQRFRAELEHGSVKSADVEFRSELFSVRRFVALL
jgi:hypothetical protein